ncbi:MAG: hypothetical protein HXX80_06075 [Nitrososphaerales archaeon]|nr:hypothetical protein [Nitrososphaerales archaeon]
MLEEEYVTIKLELGTAFLRRDSLERLSRVDAMIFDCDGVLIDARKSYLAAIKETVNYIFSLMTGLRIEERFLDELIYILKKGGGFNNDWAVSYAISLLALTVMPEEAKEEFMKIADSEPFKAANRPLDRVRLFGGISKRIGEKDLKISEEASKGLTELVERASSSGFGFFEKNLFSNDSILSDLKFLCSGKKFLSYPGMVGESPLITIFEEKFLGCKLFGEVYKIGCVFHEGSGLIEREEIMIKREILQRISSLIGRANYGIASGRPFFASRYTLRSLLNEFKPEARVFLEDIDRAERDAKQKGEMVDLSKPNPYSLLKCAKGLMPFDYVLYLGDSMEDAIMVDLANKVERRYLFGGIYDCAIMKDRQIQDFLEKGADLILPSVRGLPLVLECIKEGRTLA